MLRAAAWAESVVYCRLLERVRAHANPQDRDNVSEPLYSETAKHHVEMWQGKQQPTFGGLVRLSGVQVVPVPVATGNVKHYVVTSEVGEPNDPGLKPMCVKEIFFKYQLTDL